ncbi:SEC-C motif-containing protein [Actimicrobium sp. GrIS 1.19]|uniref:YchJ family protein n=1 Tax=Actimicrobium sp. GrIS 1.19 TaxID=3071708 RepID=UPI002E01AFC0|nr:SEC-C motif-containing protein [Actimicrobium sp. GrIS 1.19]
MSQLCPCGGGDYVSCCGRFIDAGAVAASAEELMRSRYTAYTRGAIDYLRATWSSSTCPPDLAHDPHAKWLGLDVRKIGGNGDHASVEFVARYKIHGRAHRLHEVSRFVRDDGRWLYLDGSFPESRATP